MKLFRKRKLRGSLIAFCSVRKVMKGAAEGGREGGLATVVHSLGFAPFSFFRI